MMNLKVFLFFFLLLPQFLGAQDFAKVDAIVATFPSQISNTKALAEKIDTHFDSDVDKVRAIFSWITNNISYSYDAPKLRSSYSYTTEEEKNRIISARQTQLANLVMAKKVAVCQGYSNLFKELCDQLGIACKIVTGNGKISVQDIRGSWDSNHAWNLVEIDGEPKLIDATWGAGSMKGTTFKKERNESYFLALPEDLIKNHYPDNFEDALLDRKISRMEYFDAPIYYEIDSKKIQLLSPAKTGVLKARSQVEFSFKSEKPVRWVSYTIGTDSYHIFPKDQEPSSLKFLVDLNGGKGEEMVIFMEGEPIVAYAIEE